MAAHAEREEKPYRPSPALIRLFTNSLLYAFRASIVAETT
jgi:hypothetical protein